MDGSSFCNLRLCTSAECRYKLCGITVAPMMPIATYIMPAWRKCGDQSPPHLQKAGLGLRQNENLDEVADRDGRDQHQHHGFDRAHAEALQAPAAATRPGR